MTRQVFQIVLNVPEGTGLDCTTEEYAALMETALVLELEDGKLPGAAQVEVEYVGEA